MSRGFSFFSLSLSLSRERALFTPWTYFSTRQDQEVVGCSERVFFFFFLGWKAVLRHFRVLAWRLLHGIGIVFELSWARRSSIVAGIA